MISERLRLTLLYFAASVAIALVVAIAIRSGRISDAYKSAAREALVNAEIAAKVIQRMQPSNGPVMVPDSYATGVLLDPGVVELLKVVPNYLMVVGSDTTVHFQSWDIYNLGDADKQVLFGGMNGITDDGPAGVVTITRGEVVLIAVSLKNTSKDLVRVVAGGLAERPSWSKELILAFTVVVPLIIFGSTWFVWFLLGSSFQRTERIRQEVAAISDGRSLHRRLSEYEAGPELTTLIETLNAMIARLESSFMVLRRFTADASHELKTPLAVLRIDIERAMDEKTSKDERMIALEEALQQVTRMSDLVESLLTLARADEGRFTLDREPVDLQALTLEVYETALILGEGAGVSVSMPFTTDATIMGDRDRLRQLFLNLVANAIKYTPEGGRVDIGLGKHPATITFAVRDTGIGISAADIPHVFERFWRADRVRSRSSQGGGGVGLGLAISQWIAQAHGGTLTVSSRLGKGSLFTVTLPSES